VNWCVEEGVGVNIHCFDLSSLYNNVFFFNLYIIKALNVNKEGGNL